MPSIAHLLYIPGILLVGIAIGFVLGARSARQELQARLKERQK